MGNWCEQGCAGVGDMESPAVLPLAAHLSQASSCLTNLQGLQRRRCGGAMSSRSSRSHMVPRRRHLAASVAALPVVTERLLAARRLGRAATCRRQQRLGQPRRTWRCLQRHQPRRSLARERQPAERQQQARSRACRAAAAVALHPARLVAQAQLQARAAAAARQRLARGVPRRCCSACRRAATLRNEIRNATHSAFHQTSALFKLQ